jgi:hypothetical protein
MRRTFILSAVFVGALLAGGAVFHPQLLRRFGSADRCPHLAKGAELEEARKKAVASLAGEGAAPTTNVLGFAVGKATKPEILAWALANSVTCSDVDGVALRCAVLASATVPVAGGVFYRFDGPRLVGIDLIAPAANDAEASSLFQRIRSKTTETFGTPHTDDNAKDLASAPAGRLASSWRFKDLAVDVSAFRGLDGTRLRLQARALN